MITSRDRVIRALMHEPLDRAPRDLWVPRGTEILRGDEVAELACRYPNDIIEPDFHCPSGQRARGKPDEAGRHTDAWGCTWEREKRGGPRRLTGHPLADPSALAEYQPPRELLDRTGFARVSAGCDTASQFVLARTETRPFQRLLTLRGMEATVADLAGDGRQSRQLLAMLHEFSCREMEMWGSTTVDGVALGDRWIVDNDSPIPRPIWRELLKPLYRQYCRILHENDKFVFFYSSGKIADVFRDLVEIGVDAIHCDQFNSGNDTLARQIRGKVALWSGIDQPQVLAQGTPADVRTAVRRLRRGLDSGSGGLIAQSTWEPETPLENIAALFEHWLEPILAHV